MCELNNRDVLDMPFATNEQKFEYWQQSKAVIKELRLQLLESNKKKDDYEIPFM